jgi:hypothetical protein
VAVALRDTLAANLALIERSPTAFPVVHRDVRRCLLGRFPYALYFRLLPNELRVIACTHRAGMRDAGSDGADQIARGCGLTRKCSRQARSGCSSQHRQRSDGALRNEGRLQVACS